MTKACLLHSIGDTASVAHGKALLTNLLQQVESMHFIHKTIKVLTQQAWTYDLPSRESEAFELLAAT